MWNEVNYMENTKDKNANKPKIDLTKVIIVTVSWIGRIIIAYIKHR